MSKSRVLPKLEPSGHFWLGERPSVATAPRKEVDVTLGRLSAGAEPSAPRTGASAESEPDLRVAFEQACRDGFAKGMANAEHRLSSELLKRREELDAKHEALQRERDDKLAKQMQALAALATQLNTQWAERLEEVDIKAVELAFAALSVLCGPADKQSDAELRTKLMRDVIRQGLRQVKRGSSCTIRLHPCTLEVVRGSSSEQRQWGAWKWLADATLQENDCVLDTSLGQYDIGLNQQLGALLDAWRASLTAV